VARVTRRRWQRSRSLSRGYSRLASLSNVCATWRRVSPSGRKPTVEGGAHEFVQEHTSTALCGHRTHQRQQDGRTRTLRTPWRPGGLRLCLWYHAGPVAARRTLKRRAAHPAGVWTPDGQESHGGNSGAAYGDVHTRCYRPGPERSAAPGARTLSQGVGVVI